MTTANTSEKKTKRSREKAGAQASGTPAPLPAAYGQPVKSRKRLWLASLGIALVLAGGYAAWKFTTTASETVSVLVLKESVARGEAIAEGDLTTMGISGGQTTDTFAASKSTEVLGKVASVDLPAGSLLTSKNIVGELIVPEGSTIVGVALTQTQLPSHPLSAGDEVRLVDTPVAQGEPPLEAPTTSPATVFSVKFDDANKVWIVDLIVPKQQAAAIAARAATQRVALILDGLGE